MQKWLIPAGVLVVVATTAWLLTSSADDPSDRGGDRLRPPPQGGEANAGGSESGTKPADPDRGAGGQKPDGGSTAGGGQDGPRGEYGPVASLDQLSENELAWFQSQEAENALLFRGTTGLLLIAPRAEEEPPPDSPLFGRDTNAAALEEFAELVLLRQEALDRLAESMSLGGKIPRHSTLALAERARVESEESEVTVILPVANGFVLISRHQFGNDPELGKLDVELEATSAQMGVGTIRVYGVPDPVR